jgi:hypothetical protein
MPAMFASEHIGANLSAGMNEASGTDALMPLSQAAIEAYAVATGKQTTNPDTLTKVARAIASRIRVFTREHGANEFALVWPDEIREGKMRLGGEALQFPDGRSLLENLSIHRDELAAAIAEVRKLYEQRRI